MLFALPGAAFLLAPAYAALAQREVPLAGRYGLVLLLGATTGAALLGFISSGEVHSALVGSLYGATTAACWITLHYISSRAAPTAP